MTKFPAWKYFLLIILTVLGLLYAAPSFYSEDPAVQVTANNSRVPLNDAVVANIEAVLEETGTPFKSVELSEQSILVRFPTVNDQLAAIDPIKVSLGDEYTTALNLAPNTPEWMNLLGAEPMKLGLDLRGGVHFLLAIDVDSLIAHRIAGDARSMNEELRHERIRYSSFKVTDDNVIQIRFRDQNDFNKTLSLIKQRFPELLLLSDNSNGEWRIDARMSPTAELAAENYAVDQTMTILRNRINELGVAEPIVQRQGSNRIAVDLPGIQDTARAKQILGGTATIEMHLVDVDHDPIAAAASKKVPAGTHLYDYEGRPVLLKNRIILSGTSITGAVSSIGEDGRPSVSIRLGGGGEALFYRITGENVGKPMAILYVETKMDGKLVDGEVVYTPRKQERVISVATIKSALPNNFQISGIQDAQEARNLSLLLRAGALPAPITIIEESTVGPSLGKDNIDKGILSVEIGFIFIVIFMVVYYRLMGLIANLALALNIVFVVALLSILGATLTLPGIAGIVLTVGMAVDANVLIFERIREELRNGMSIPASIDAGYERAFTTIVDANVTTLIAAIALFALGTGAVKGFAVTLTIGLLTSMFTAITGTRGVVHLIYGRRSAKKISIGI